MRRPTGSWDEKSGRYYARLGRPKKIGGRATAVPLLREDGTPVAKGDEQARAWAIARLLGERGRIEEAIAAGPTIADVCRAYVLWQVDRGAAERTVKDHHKHLNRVCRFVVDARPLGSRSASSLRPEDVWAIQDASDGAIRLVVHSILACWRWAARPIRGRTPTKLIAVNSLHGLERPPAGSRTDSEVNWPIARRVLRLARAAARSTKPAPGRLKATRTMLRLRVLCLHLIAVAGVRPHEAVGLRWDEVLWDEEIIAIDSGRDKRRRPGRKPRKARRFVVPPKLLTALRIVRAWDNASPTWCFVTAHQTREPSMRMWHHWFDKWLKPAVTEATKGLPKGWTAYWLRHAAINEALREGVSSEIVGDQFGNSPEAMRSYAHAADKVRHEVADSVKRGRRKGRE